MAPPIANRNAGQVDIGPGLLYVTKLGTPEPAGLDDSAWTSVWVELGYTDKGSSFKSTPTVDEVRVAEETVPVQTIVSARKDIVTIEMAQMTAWNLAVALGGGTIQTASGITTFEPPTAGTEQELMLGWRSKAMDEALLWRRVKPTATLNLDRTAGNTKALVSAEFSVLIPLLNYRTVADGVTNATTTVTSATAAFSAADVGKPISGAGIPAATTIASVTNATTAVLSQAATASASGVALTIGSTTALKPWKWFGADPAKTGPAYSTVFV